MTAVSEQGKFSILWSVFEGEPFCSPRMATFAKEQDCRDYLLWKQGHCGTLMEVRTIARLESENKALREVAKAASRADDCQRSTVQFLAAMNDLSKALTALRDVGVTLE